MKILFTRYFLKNPKFKDFDIDKTLSCIKSKYPKIRLNYHLFVTFLPKLLPVPETPLNYILLHIKIPPSYF